MLGIKHSVRGLNMASQAIRTRALSVSAVSNNTVSMREPMGSSSVAEKDSIYKNFLVPDSEKYRKLQDRQHFYTEHILEDMWTLTDNKNPTSFTYPRYAVVILGVLTYLFTHYRITQGKKKREGQVI